MIDKLDRNVLLQLFTPPLILDLSFYNFQNALTACYFVLNYDVEITFSRHAKNRAKLYKISELIIQRIVTARELAQGKHEIIENIEGPRYPLKLLLLLKKT